MNEINYKGLYLQASYGEFVELMCFLFKPADPSFKERLNHLTILIETYYHEKVELFKKTGDLNLFDNNEILMIIKEILDI